MSLRDTMPCAPPDFDAPSDDEREADERAYQEAIAADEARAALYPDEPRRLMSDGERAAFLAAHPTVDVVSVRHRLFLGAL